MKAMILALMLCACGAQTVTPPAHNPVLVEHCGKKYSEELYKKLQASGQLPECSETN